MKKNSQILKTAAFIVTAMFIMTLSLPIAAAKVSPALDVIANNYGMTKVSLVARDVYFDAEDFDAASGLKKVGRIVVESLPESSDGTLMLGNIALSVGQSIGRKNFENIRFVPRNSGEVEATFKFSADTGSESAYTCMIYMLENENSAPTASPISLETYSDIKIYGKLSASDAEFDSLTYSIVAEPERGTVTLNDKSVGSFSYTPDKVYKGADSFTYTVSDKYGNVSNTATVSLEILERDTNIVFDDLDNHFAHFAAIKTVSEGVMSFYADEGAYTFEPDEPISRAEFCASLLKSAGYTGFTAVNSTVYADDADIPSEYKGYISAASILGITKGAYSDSGELNFCPNNQITRAEAAVMINRLYGFETDGAIAVSSFADAESVPTWAAPSISALVNARIINGDVNGNISPYSGLTRAEAAVMLAGLTE